MKKRHKFLLGLSLTTMLALSACSGGGSADSFVGDWGSTGPGQPNLTISQSLEISGTDGCNLVFAEGEISGDTLLFNNFGLTAMYCEGVDAWFSGTASATISKDDLVLLDNSGTEIGTLPKQ